MSYAAHILLIPATGLMDSRQQTRMYTDFYLCWTLKNTFDSFVECYLCVKKRLQCAVG